MNQDKKGICADQKKLDIARVRGYDPHDVFRYDLVKDSFLFDSDSLMKKLFKHELVQELETCLDMGVDYIPQAKWDRNANRLCCGCNGQYMESPDVVHQYLWSTVPKIHRDD